MHVWHFPVLLWELRLNGLVEVLIPCPVHYDRVKEVIQGLHPLANTVYVLRLFLGIFRALPEALSKRFLGEHSRGHIVSGSYVFEDILAGCCHCAVDVLQVQ